MMTWAEFPRAGFKLLFGQPTEYESRPGPLLTAIRIPERATSSGRWDPHQRQYPRCRKTIGNTGKTIMNKHLIHATIATVLLCGCSSKPLDGAGNYTLDATHFAGNVADEMIAEGKAPAEARAIIVEQLKNSKFDLTLNNDGSFDCEQMIANDHHEYTGTWTLDGTKIRLHQTHDNGREIEDVMSGQLVDGKMQVSLSEKSDWIKLVLYHQSAAAAPPR